MLSDKADPAQDKFFKASALENMNVQRCLEGWIIGGFPTCEGINTKLPLRYVNVDTMLPHATRFEEQCLRYLMMVERISEDKETLRKRYTASSIQMGAGGELSVYYSADEERAAAAQQWCNFGPAKGFFYLAQYFVPYNIEAMSSRRKRWNACSRRLSTMASA